MKVDYMRSLVGFLTALLLGGALTSTAFADQTVTLNVPVNFTNIPTNVIGMMSVNCYIFPQTVSASSLTTWGSLPNVVPLGSNSSKAVTLTGATYSGTFSIPIQILSQSLVGVTQPLPYECLVYLYATGVTPSPDANELQPPALTPLLTQNPNTALIVSGVVPLVSSPAILRTIPH